MARNRYEDAEAREQNKREVIYLTQRLKDMLPADDIDTSYFGYNIADAALDDYLLAPGTSLLSIPPLLQH